MSVDDTILIIAFNYNGRRVYTVIHCQNAENFYMSWDYTSNYIYRCYLDNRIPDLGCRQIDQKLRLFDRYSDAWAEADRIETELSKDSYPSEYGIVYLDKYINKTFNPATVYLTQRKRQLDPYMVATEQSFINAFYQSTN